MRGQCEATTTHRLYSPDRMRNTGDRSQFGELMNAGAENEYEASADAAAWIADATRRLAGLSPSGTSSDDRWEQSGSTLSEIRSSIAQRISAFPRQGILIRTTRPGVTVSHIALAKLLTWTLAESAAAGAAAVADVELRVDARELAAVHIHLIGVGVGARRQTYLRDGDELRDYAALLLQGAIGDNSAQITVSWDDLVVV